MCYLQSFPNSCTTKTFVNSNVLVKPRGAISTHLTATAAIPAFRCLANSSKQAYQQKSEQQPAVYFADSNPALTSNIATCPSPTAERHCSTSAVVCRAALLGSSTSQLSGNVTISEIISVEHMQERNRRIGRTGPPRQAQEATAQVQRMGRLRCGARRGGRGRRRAPLRHERLSSVDALAMKSASAANASGCGICGERFRAIPIGSNTPA